MHIQLQVVELYQNAVRQYALCDHMVDDIVLSAFDVHFEEINSFVATLVHQRAKRFGGQEERFRAFGCHQCAYAATGAERGITDIAVRRSKCHLLE